MSAAKGFKTYADKYGLQILHYETYPVEMEDITPVLQKVKGKNPDILCVGSHTVVAMMVMKQSKEINFNPKAYCFSFGTLTPDFPKELGADAEYVLEYVSISAQAPYSDPLFGTAQKFVTSFKTKYGFSPDSTQTAAVAGGIAFMKAIQRARVTPPLDQQEREKVRNELNKLDIVTGAGPVRFDPSGMNEANPLGVAQYQKGKAVCVDPPSWAEGKFIYPASRWNER